MGIKNRLSEILCRFGLRERGWKNGERDVEDR